MHGRVCDALGLDDLTFSYERTDGGPLPEVPGFRIKMARGEGRGGLEVSVNSGNLGEPMRVLVSYDLPRSLQHCKETLDLAIEAVLAGGDPWTKVVAEALVAADCAVSSKDAVGFIASDLMQLPPALLTGLGKPLEFAALKFDVSAQATTDPLGTPRREVKIEVLKEDLSHLYVEVTSQWPQITASRPEDFEKVRPIDQKPSDYISDGQQYLESRLREIVTDGSPA